MCEFPGGTASNAKIGFLLGVKFFKSSVHWLEVGDQFTVIVDQDIKMATGLAVFHCQVKSELFNARARLNVFQPPDVEQFLQELKSV
jgi:predicted hotdog family 3-hydroxylacyl-ACP dehydratase